MDILIAFFYALSFTVFAVGLLTLAYYPLSLVFQWRLKKKAPVFESGAQPPVSIIVPAYNEGKVIGRCVESILASDYPDLELILVNDGSTDDTLEVMRHYAGDARIQVINKTNRGKASALNAGILKARGEVLFFVDADGLFTQATIPEMLNGFTSEKIGAVCGNDMPVNLDRIQTRLACVQTHVGTGLVRRALAAINCLPIVSGNIGAFRRSVLDQTGPFLEGFIGEDLELTWRVHKAGFQVNFAPNATVLAESPSTISGLWKQRIRWARGLLQTARLHHALMFNPKVGAFSFYLPVNLASMLVIPILQLAAILILPILVFTGHSPLGLNIGGLIGWLGLGVALFASLFAISLDRAWTDLRYIYTIIFWIPYSLMMDVVTIWAIILETSGQKAEWNKLDRTGVVSRKSLT